MSEKSIRLIDERYLARAMPAPVAGRPPGANIADRFGRRLHDLRISVTDRCNFRCAYCMPKSVFDRDYAFLPQSAMLNFEEIYRLASIFVGLGTDKLRITGGEPLLRKHLERLIAMLAQLRTPTGQSPDLTLTTNGALLRKKAAALREAGLRRLTVSLDAIDDPVFRQMNDVEFAVSEVLDGLQAATEAGFESIKVNMVV
ncbi:MAG: radical SAM protein, partial [Betaproteobacteria bacterium]|nr:radical SAM protein [Betaproteobacteria bacterium]